LAVSIPERESSTKWTAKKHLPIPIQVRIY